MPWKNTSEKQPTLSSVLQRTGPWHLVYVVGASVIFMMLLQRDHDYMCRYSPTLEKVVSLLGYIAPGVLIAFNGLRGASTQPADYCFLTTFYAFILASIVGSFVVYLVILGRRLKRVEPDSDRLFLVTCFCVFILIIKPTTHQILDGNSELVLFLQDLLMYTGGGMSLALAVANFVSRKRIVDAQKATSNHENDD
jgi:hypothetical protein